MCYSHFFSRQNAVLKSHSDQQQYFLQQVTVVNHPQGMFWKFDEELLMDPVILNKFKKMVCKILVR